jgi:hypothetical protein
MSGIAGSIGGHITTTASVMNADTRGMMRNGKKWKLRAKVLHLIEVISEMIIL